MVVGHDPYSSGAGHHWDIEGFRDARSRDHQCHAGPTRQARVPGGHEPGALRVAGLHVAGGAVGQTTAGVEHVNAGDPEHGVNPVAGLQPHNRSSAVTISVPREEVVKMLERAAGDVGLGLRGFYELGKADRLDDPSLRDMWLIWGDTLTRGPPGRSVNGPLQAKSDEFASHPTSVIRGCVVGAPEFGVDVWNGSRVLECP